MVLRATGVLLGVLMMGCAISPDTPDTREQPYRCFEGVDLHQLIMAETLPPLDRSGWHTGGASRANEDRLFDGQQVADLPLDPPSPFVQHLCNRLKEQLAGRCQVKEFWAGADSCAGVFESPAKAVTASDGTYKLRPVRGRVSLLSARAQDGKPKVVLTTTEWKD